MVENAPTCYRAPRWPDPEFPRKIPKKYPPARNSGLPEFTFKIPRKYRKNTPKIPKMPILGIFSVFSGYFLGVQNFGPGGYFFGIFRGNSGSSSVAGRGVLKHMGSFGIVFLLSYDFRIGSVPLPFSSTTLQDSGGFGTS